MKDRGGGGPRQPPLVYPRVIKDYSAGTYNVSTNTPLPLGAASGFVDLGSDFRAVAVFFENQDLTRSAFLILEVSHGGSKPVDPPYRLEVKPNTEGFIIIEAGNNPFTYFRLSAETDSGLSYPTIVGRYAAVGMPR